MKGKGVLIFILLIVFCSSSFQIAVAKKGSEKKEENIFTLEKLVVTATKTQKDIKDAPGSVSVIYAEDLKKRNVKTLDEAINILSGIFVKRSKGLMDSTASVRMRGFNSDRYVLILLDGQPLNDAYTGGVEWGTFPINNIERIEIIRGPASALYGGNAMGGVINIITKTPDKLEFEVGGGYGSYDTYRYRISAGNRFLDKLSIRIGYEGEDTDGYETTPVVRSITSGTGNVSGGYPMDDKYGKPTKWVVGDKGENRAKRWSLDGKLSFDFSDTGNLSFTFFSGEHKYEYGPPNTYMGTFGSDSTYAIVGPNQRARFTPNDFISYTGIGKNETETYTMSFEELLGKVKINGQVGYVEVDDRYTIETGKGMDDYYNSKGSLKITENRSWFAELRGSVPIGNSHMLTLGSVFRQDQSDTDDFDIPFYRSFSNKEDHTFYSGGKARTWSVFLQDEWQITAPLTLYLGLRYDSWKVYDGASGVPGQETEYDSNTESHWSPKVSAVWKVFDYTIVKASIGHAFRPPTLYELYRTWKSWSTTYQSNPELEPETVWTYEIGVEQYLFNGKARIALSAYKNDIDDLIYYQLDGSVKKRVNVGQARTYGLEAEASCKLTDYLNVWGNVSFVDAQIIDNPADPKSEGKRITGIPKFMYNIGMDIEYKWIRGSLIGRYFSKIYNDPHNKDKAEGVYGTYEPAFFLDAKVSFMPLDWIEFSISVDNILDKEYYEYYKTSGRTFFAELTLKY